MTRTRRWRPRIFRRMDLTDLRAVLSRRGFMAAFLAAMLLATGAAAADDPAAAFVQDLGNRTIQAFQGGADKSFEEREAVFREIMVAGFDIPIVSRFVLGRHWKTATKEQREAYRAIFLDFIVRVYSSRFGNYGGEEFKVVSSIEMEGGDRMVRAQIHRPTDDVPISVDFRVRQREEGLKIIDVVVEGISMLHTHRVEFASVINRKGFDGLVADLRARVEAPPGHE